MKLKMAATVTAITASALLAPVASAVAMTPDGHGVPSNCGGKGKTYDSYGTASASTGVYSSPGKNKVGTLPKGNWFCYNSSTGTFVGQTYYVKGYGYGSSGNNGSKVSGWINDYYVAG